MFYECKNDESSLPVGGCYDKNKWWIFRIAFATTPQSDVNYEMLARIIQNSFIQNVSKPNVTRPTS